MEWGWGCRFADPSSKPMGGSCQRHALIRTERSLRSSCLLPNPGEPMPASIEYIRAGKLRALAVTTATRSEALPDIPTMAEFLPDYEASGWFGIGAPKNTPYEIIDKLNKEINAGLADPKLKAQLADLGRIILGGPPGNFNTLIAEAN